MNGHESNFKFFFFVFSTTTLKDEINFFIREVFIRMSFTFLVALLL